MLLAVLMFDFEQSTGSCLILKHKHGIYYQQIFLQWKFPRNRGWESLSKKLRIGLQ